MFFTKVGLLNWYFPMKKNRKIRIIFNIEKWLRKSEFCNFEGLITSTENVQKKFNAIFVISGELASFWKVFFFKFRWHDQKFTWGRANDTGGRLVGSVKWNFGSSRPVTSSSHVFTNPEFTKPDFFHIICRLFWSVQNGL